MHLDGDMALVVVQREHDIEFTGDGAIEYRVSWNRARRRDPHTTGIGHCGRQFFDFLILYNA